MYTHANNKLIQYLVTEWMRERPSSELCQIAGWLLARMDIVDSLWLLHRRVLISLKSMVSLINQSFYLMWSVCYLLLFNYAEEVRKICQKEFSNIYFFDWFSNISQIIIFVTFYLIYYICIFLLIWNCTNHYQMKGAFSLSSLTPNSSQSWFSIQSSWHESSLARTAPPFQATSLGSMSCRDREGEGKWNVVSKNVLYVGSSPLDWSWPPQPRSPC